MSLNYFTRLNSKFGLIDDQHENECIFQIKETCLLYSFKERVKMDNMIF